MRKVSAGCAVLGASRACDAGRARLGSAPQTAAHSHPLTVVAERLLRSRPGPCSHRHVPCGNGAPAWVTPRGPCDIGTWGFPVLGLGGRTAPAVLWHVWDRKSYAVQSLSVSSESCSPVMNLLFRIQGRVCWPRPALLLHRGHSLH